MLQFLRLDCLHGKTALIAYNVKFTKREPDVFILYSGNQMTNRQISFGLELLNN